MVHSIASCGRATVMLGRLLLDGIPRDRFARLSTPGGTAVESNHPCFVYGHLSLYCDRACALLGDEAGARELAPPERWTAIFGAGTPCRDDPDGSVYPPMEEVTDRFGRGYERMIAAVENASATSLEAPNPSEGMRERLGLATVADAVNFLLTSHAMMHLGQVSAWRRMEGLGPVM